MNEHAMEQAVGASCLIISFCADIALSIVAIVSQPLLTGIPVTAFMLFLAYMSASLLKNTIRELRG